jgi:hypothetical protein
MTQKSCNILLNGSRRKSYEPNGLLNIGVNIPWAPAEYTIVDDMHSIKNMIKNWNVDPLPKNTKIIMSFIKYKFLKQHGGLETIKDRLHAVYKTSNPNTKQYGKSSGHDACEWAISQGYTVLNIYGCDNYFGDDECLESFTHDFENNKFATVNKYVDLLTEQERIERGILWRAKWHYMINKYPGVTFNFVP